jgi:tetratricopeptide (TPR) repeat protein
LNYPHNISPEELERIERYLTGSMEESEANVYSQELEASDLLKEKTREVRLLLLAINEQSLQQALHGYHDEMNGAKNGIKKNAKVMPISRKWLMAACAIGIIMISVWAILQMRNQNERLYSEYYKPDPGLPTYMSSSSDYNFQKAMVEYKNGEFDKALKAWTALLNAKPGNDTLKYFVAVTYLGLGESQRAIEKLQPVASDTASAFNKDACWYLGLSYLKQNRLDSALIYIDRSGHPESVHILQALKTK